MANLNRQQRRSLKKRVEGHRKSREKYRKQENEIQELREQIISGIEACVRHTLEKEFGFGKKRMQKFVTHYDQIIKSTNSGFTLMKDGVSLGEFRMRNEVGIHQ